MNATNYAKMQVQEAFGLMNASAQGMDESQYNWAPGGTCNAVAKSHVHALSSIDFFVNGIAKGGAPLLWGTYAQKAGAPANPMEIWAFSGAIPQPIINEYATAVQEAALGYVSSLSDADLDREIETQFFGRKSLAWVIQLIGLHCAGHAGDMASVKGMQGLKGLPF